jgi:hypothetical protein
MSLYDSVKASARFVFDGLSGNRAWNKYNLDQALAKTDPGEDAEKRLRYGMVKDLHYIQGAQWLLEHDDQVRAELEAETIHTVPKQCVHRAVCYASLIYQWATHNKAIDLERVENIIRAVNGGRGLLPQGRVVAHGNRSYGQLVDPRVGWAVVVVEQPAGAHVPPAPPLPPLWKQIYVVFRGSRGSRPEDLIKNPQGAGWAPPPVGAAQPGRSLWDSVFHPGLDLTRRNIDWRANFDNQQVPWRHNGGANVQVHRGFKTVYDSMRTEIYTAVTNHRRAGERVFVTGHSLGGALATLCAFDLHHRHLNPVCLSFNAPRVGNENFAREFNRELADQTFTYQEQQGGLFRRSYRFDQKDDPVTWGQKYAFLHALDPASDMGESGGALMKGLKAAMKQDDLLQAYFHVKNRKTVSFWGEHKYTEMMDAILGINASNMAGLFDCKS